MKVSRKKKNSFLIFALAIIAIILIILSIILAFSPISIQLPMCKKEIQKVQEKVEIVEIQKPENQDTTRKQAVDATVEQFKRLGEDVSENDLKVDVITRNGQQYYYIKSKQNSIQIDVNTGKVVRINSVSL